MASYHDEYVFVMAQPQQQNMYFHPQIQYTGFPQQHLQPEMMHHTFGPFVDFSGAPDPPDPLYYADFDDGNEIPTRPRLTKEQVDILEGEFQANPKPNSGTKRHLAQITNLNLPRVANWFQNRRAKAKQQRKQEEYEEAQQRQTAVSMQGNAQKATEEENDDDEEEDEEDEDDVEIKQESDQQQAREDRVNPAAETQKPKLEMSPPRSPEGKQPSTSARERAEASLRRALAAAEAAQPAHPVKVAAEEHIPHVPMPDSQHRHALTVGTSSQGQLESRAFWGGSCHAQDSWLPSPQGGGGMNFDFGFGTSDTQMLNEHGFLPSPAESTSQDFRSPNPWDNSIPTPTLTSGLHCHPQQGLHSESITMSSYVGDRRPSIADTITNNFDSIEIAPQMSFQTSGSVSSNGSENGINLASRRRRPQLAQLTSASLRSRSYGALTATSPTFRQGMTPPSTQTLRHVKSTGHSLNHYAGIRKSSIPQKSPLHYTFAEAEAFKQLMNQKALQSDLKQQLSPITTSSMTLGGSQEQVMCGLPHGTYATVSTGDMQQRTPVHSPPATPFNQNFYQSSSVIPGSIQQQYATVSETPPYSAGPMTNTSWDFPLTSPDLATFPQASLMPSLPFSTAADDQSLNAWMPVADQSAACDVGTPTGKEAEFFIHEFPGQKEELAQTAKLLDRPAPKHYAFENRGQRDFALS